MHRLPVKWKCQICPENILITSWRILKMHFVMHWLCSARCYIMFCVIIYCCWVRSKVITYNKGKYKQGLVLKMKDNGSLEIPLTIINSLMLNSDIHYSYIKIWLFPLAITPDFDILSFRYTMYIKISINALKQM